MPLQRVCYDCGRETDERRARCTCGEPLWLDTDPEDFDWSDVTDAPGLWRYEALLPVGMPTPGRLAAAAGGTPLLREPELDGFAGTKIHLKVEGQHPTGSFKDRGSALALAAIEAGLEDESGHQIDAVGTVSHGNMAMSMAAYAASFGLPCVVLVPDDIPEERLGVIAQFDPEIRRVQGDYGRLYRDSLEAGAAHDIAFVNSDVPLRVEGQKTTALEICEAFAPTTPDAIVMPVSSGGHASGVWKALRELESAGAIDEIPRLYFVQAAACAPIAEAFATGAETVSPIEGGGGETIAYSIANADPPSGNRVLRAARETGGSVIAVDDEEIREAQRELATEAGLTVEAASAVPLAGARLLAEAGTLANTDDVAVITTGTGLKEAAGSAAAASTETVGIDRLDAELSTFAE
ncbi:pyridoxal-phosphate dependent enzyme [Natronomonas halophila]|uniref:threonine synthase n=1 Tax=Natronomonas halophila TaxID=2747817 RepID=UPI0015B58894|nr:pyridoxal-phosphate dependent enzyme [Natronomonas halophila]QLD86068.1 pyridoxal-phosphate dependent enzyme [Natronomonas halophila]